MTASESSYLQWIDGQKFLKGRLMAKYKNRDPDPGPCLIHSIDWEERRLTVSNGCCRYYQSFDEVDICSL